MALINGKEYDYSQIIVNALSVPLVGVTEINYEEEQTKEYIMASGKRPVSLGEGGISGTASIGLLMSEVEKLRKAAPNRSLLQLARFDITVTYLNPEGTVGVVNHTIKDCVFTKDGAGGAVGDTSISKVFDLAISKVEY